MKRFERRRSATGSDLRLAPPTGGHTKPIPERPCPKAADTESSRHALLRIRTRRTTEFVDITDRIQAILAACRIRARLLNIQTLHTTTGIVVNEHEPLLFEDFESTLEKLVPAAASYRHDAADVRIVNLMPDERVNGHAHCRALLLPSSACLNVVDGRLLLGRWQRVFFAELDGPQERVLSLMVMGLAPADAATGECERGCLLGDRR